MWLKDPSEVDRLRGIDVPESNFRITGCQDAVDSLSKEEIAYLARELDALVAVDRAKFEVDCQNSQYRQEISERLNEALGRSVVKEWSAELWKMAF